MTTQREGWLGEEYVRIYAATDRPRIAEQYGFATSLPGYEPWGSWGLDALCLGPDLRLYTVDWIPLEEGFRKERYASVEAFEEDIARLHEATPAYEHFQKEVHFAHPLVLGGDPNAAPILIDQSAHAKAFRFFNQVYARMKDPRRTGLQNLHAGRWGVGRLLGRHLRVISPRATMISHWTAQ